MRRARVLFGSLAALFAVAACTSVDSKKTTESTVSSVVPPTVTAATTTTTTVPPTTTPTTVPWQSMVQQVQAGVLEVHASACTGNGGFTGTAFLIDSQHAATAAHVVRGGRRFSVTSPELTNPVSAVVVGIDLRQDAALLAFSTTIPGHLFEFESTVPPAGAPIGLLGYPLGLARRPVYGTVSVVDLQNFAYGEGTELYRPDLLIEHSMPSDHGDSGGPLINPQTGGVVGMNVAGYDSITQNGRQIPIAGINFGVEAAVVAPLFDQWQSKAQPIDTCATDNPPAPPPTVARTTTAAPTTTLAPSTTAAPPTTTAVAPPTSAVGACVTPGAVDRLRGAFVIQVGSPELSTPCNSIQAEVAGLARRHNNLAIVVVPSNAVSGSTPGRYDYVAGPYASLQAASDTCTALGFKVNDDCLPRRMFP